MTVLRWFLLLKTMMYSFYSILTVPCEVQEKLLIPFSQRTETEVTRSVGNRKMYGFHCPLAFENLVLVTDSAFLSNTFHFAK